MDALYIGWLRRPIYRFGIGPNKMLDYLMSARPIIHGVEAGNDPVAESGCGVSIPPENPAALADAIRDLSRVDRDARLAMGARGRQFALAHHDFRVLARRFMDVAEGRSADADVV
jgi:glycosyltransferase involved in cell wall biosynthesis